MWLQTLVLNTAALAGGDAVIFDPFEGYRLRETLISVMQVAKTERCIVAAGVAAYPVRGDGFHDVIFFTTMQTLSGRNLPIWRLSPAGDGSKLEVYALGRKLKRARQCFKPAP